MCLLCGIHKPPTLENDISKKKAYCKHVDSGFVLSSSLGESYDYCFGNLGLKLRYRSGLDLKMLFSG